MSRIGRYGSQVTRMFDLNTNSYEPPYEEYKGWYGGLLPDSEDLFRIPTRNASMLNTGRYGSTKNIELKETYDRMKTRDNADEYALKVGKRPEGLVFASAQDRPYVNMNENFENNTIPMKYTQFKRPFREKLAKTYPEELKEEIKPTETDYAEIVLNKTEKPYAKNTIPSEMEFIEEGMGETFTDIGDNMFQVDSNGSNMRQNHAENQNQFVGPISARDIYNKYTGPKTVSNINKAQLDNFKAKQLVGMYSGTPTEGKSTLQSAEMLQKKIDRYKFKQHLPLKSIRKYNKA
jgi:hypothetical protein